MLWQKEQGVLQSHWTADGKMQIGQGLSFLHVGICHRLQWHLVNLMACRTLMILCLLLIQWYLKLIENLGCPLARLQMHCKQVVQQPGSIVETPT